MTITPTIVVPLRFCTKGHLLAGEADIYRRPNGHTQCRKCVQEREKARKPRKRTVGAHKYALGYRHGEPMPEDQPVMQTGWKRYQLGPLDAKLRGKDAVKLVVALFVQRMGHEPTVCLCTVANVCELEGIICRVANPAMGEPMPVGDMEFDLR